MFYVFLNKLFLRRFLLVMTTRTHFISPSSTIIRLSRSSLLATLFGLVTLLLFPVAASAHAEYVSSDPAANAILKTAPSTITIHFSEELDLTKVGPNGNTILIYDVNHQLVSQDGSAQVDRNDLKKMTVALQPGKSSEIYVVDWQTIAADDQHHDAGSFRFFVNPNPMLVDELNANNKSGQTNTSSGLPVWSAALIGVVGLLVGGVGGVFFGRRQPQKEK
jgi:methionine-rich copper-binding protein CopC